MSSPETQHAARGWLASRVVRILAGPLLLLAVLAGLLGWQVQHLLGRMSWVEETCQAIAQGNALHRLFADQESSLRGYLLTQDRAVLDPFYARRTEIGPALSTLSALVAGERAQVELLGGLGADHAAWERLAEAEIEGRARPGHGREPAEMRRRMEQMRAGIEGFVAHAEALRLSRIASVATQTRNTVVTGTAAFFFFAGGLALVSRRRIEEADAIFRRASDAESRLRRLWESNIIGVLYADDRGNIIEANDALLGMVGFTREDLAAGRVRWTDMTPPEHAADDERGIAEARERGACMPYEKVYIGKDGRRVPVLLGFAQLESGRSQYIVFALDLTERRRAEEQLRESEARFRTMVDALPALAWTTRPDGHVDWLNQALLDYTGAEPSELAGWSWHGIHDPELLPTVLATGAARAGGHRPADRPLDPARRRPARRDAHHPRQDPAAARAARSRRGGAPLRRRSPRRVRREPDHARRRAPGAIPVGRGRSHPPHAGGRQPAPERGEVHAGGRPSHRLGRAGRAARTGRHARTRRRRRDRARDAGAHLRAVHASRRDAGPEQGGLGLGLSLAKGLVEMHGGTVSAASDGLGKGAELTVRLPLRAAHDLPARSQPAPSPPVRTRVLVIDDNIDGAESIRDVLALEGHTVEVAFSGVEGLEKARVFEPDVVLCDIGLPGMSGYDVARALRAESGRRVPRLVALTGYAGPDDVARSLEAGFDAHLAKPPTIEKLEEVLEAR